MIDFITEHAGFVALAAFVLYALAIYKVVEVVKTLTAKIGWVKRYHVTLAAIVGLITGPFIYPWLFDVMGTTHTMPWYVGIVLGLGTGGTAVNVHNWVRKKMGGRDKGKEMA